MDEVENRDHNLIMEPPAVMRTEGIDIQAAFGKGRHDGLTEGQMLTVTVPRWQYNAFRRWFVPRDDRDGVDVFVGRARRSPGS